MGCSNVHCSYSDITINWGDRMLFFPLVDKYCEYSKKTRGEWKLLTLGIECEYNDYQGVENIVENQHTKDIEELFGVTIQEFIENFLEWNDYSDPGINEKLGISENDQVSYMFVLKDVYDVMSNPDNNDNYFLKCVDWGAEYVLNYLGFKYIGEREGTYKKIYSNGKTEVYSNGRNVEGNTYEYNGVVDVFGEDTHELEELYKHGVYSITDHLDRVSKVKLFHEAIAHHFETSHVMDGYEAYLNLQELLDRSEPLKEWALEAYGTTNIEEIEDTPDKRLLMVTLQPFGHRRTNFMLLHYANNIDHYIQFAYPLRTLISSAYSMSKNIEPFRQLKTPQGGEHSTHQKLLEAFCEINKKKIYEEDYE